MEPKDVSPEEETDDGDNTALVGSEVYVAFNHELHYPIAEDLGLVAITFVDMGDQWRQSNDVEFNYSDMVKTFGGGLRWMSPMGPLRLAYGHVFDSGDSDAKGGKFEFSMGSRF